MALFIKTWERWTFKKSVLDQENESREGLTCFFLIYIKCNLIPKVRCNRCQETSLNRFPLNIMAEKCHQPGSKLSLAQPWRDCDSHGSFLSLMLHSVEPFLWIRTCMSWKFFKLKEQLQESESPHMPRLALALTNMPYIHFTTR